MPEQTQVPVAPTSEAQEAVTSAAKTTDNLTGAELVAAFMQKRTAPAAAPAAQTTKEAEPQPAETTTPETAPPEEIPVPEETNATSPPEGEEAPEQPAEQSATEPESESKGIREMKARIDALTARLREAERERDEAKQPKTETQTQSAPQPGDYGHYPEMQQLNSGINEWRSVQQWIARNPDGGEIPGANGTPTVVTPEQAVELKIQADETVGELRAQRAVMMRDIRASESQIRSQAESQVGILLPWAKDPKSQEMETLRAFEQRVPEINRLPGWKIIAALGIDAYNKLAAQKPAQKPAPKPPKVAPATTSAAPKVDAGQKRLSEAEAAFEKSGRPNDYKRVIELRRSVKQQTARAA